MNTPVRIAALLTCFNRKTKTLQCLESFFDQVLPCEVQSSVYLVDDGSTDGTSEAIRGSFPQVKLLPGNGQLFWNGGMRVAFAEAMKSDYDYYLWLNDDTTLYPDTVSVLLKTSENLAKQGYKETIIVGSTCDPETGSFTYGGVIRKSRWHPFQFKPLEPSSQPQLCDTMNGNCVLISREVVRVVGNLDPAFTHATGDFDYGLRAKREGFTVWISPGYVGTCSRTKHKGSMDNDISLLSRFRKMKSPKEFSFSERKVFAQRYGGLLWPIYWLLPFRKWLIPSRLK